jgi:hypothetical protein
MRNLCIGLGVLSCAVVLFSSAEDVGAPVAQVQSQAMVVAIPDEALELIRQVERLRILNNADDCALLQPVPLYDGAPALEDWTTYCRARVERKIDRCSSLPAMLLPDLHDACLRDDPAAFLRS